MAGALSHIRVLDLSRILAGPWASQSLDDLGAEVIKIEHPDGGDDTRDWGPPYLRDADGEPTSESAYFLGANRNKKSVAIATEFSLPAGICTTSLKHATHFKRQIQAGMCMVNLPMAGVDYHVAFGGRKASSYGPREQGRYAAEFYTALKTVYSAAGRTLRGLSRSLRTSHPIASGSNANPVARFCGRPGHIGSINFT